MKTRSPRHVVVSISRSLGLDAVYSRTSLDSVPCALQASLTFPAIGERDGGKDVAVISMNPACAKQMRCSRRAGAESGPSGLVGGRGLLIGPWTEASTRPLLSRTFNA